jgi:hypothetical protein
VSPVSFLKSRINARSCIPATLADSTVPAKKIAYDLGFSSA